LFLILPAVRSFVEFLRLLFHRFHLLLAISSVSSEPEVAWEVVFVSNKLLLTRLALPCRGGLPSTLRSSLMTELRSSLLEGCQAEPHLILTATGRITGPVEKRRFPLPVETKRQKLFTRNL